MSGDLSLKEAQKEWHGSLKSYAIGFFTSLLLTLVSFSLVIAKVITGQTLVHTLMGLALIQAVIQLLFFLHVGQEAKPKWETLVFCFMVLILSIIVIGTLWIMYDLNDRVMSNMPMEMMHD
jgi:cytochrome o ubiquinol oxidase operon protein cyoD